MLDQGFFNFLYGDPPSQETETQQPTTKSYLNSHFFTTAT